MESGYRRHQACAIGFPIWTTFRMRTEENFRHALWRLRLSYLRYALKSASNPRNLLERRMQGCI